MEPKITVVTVTYNAEDYLEKTILSIINQTYSNIEYIIIDGGSTDGTLDIIKKYEENIDYWISEPDNGLYDAMNKGIDVATGEWINFMNAGDMFTDGDVVSTLFSQDLDVGMICGRWNLVDSDYNYISTQSPSSLETTWQRTCCNHQAMFVHISLMRENKFNLNFKYAAEKDLLLRFRQQHIIYKLVDTVICDFLFDDNGLSRKNQVNDSIDALSALSKYVENEKIFQSITYKRLVQCSPKVDKRKQFAIDFSDFYTRLTKIIGLCEDQRMVLYGYGTVTKMITSLTRMKWLVADINYSDFLDESVINPLDLRYLDYDKILITVLGRENEIIDYLTQELDLDRDKIITLWDEYE